MVTTTPIEEPKSHTFLLWRCANSECEMHRIRKMKTEVWNSSRKNQSPCPHCGTRTRLNRGNTREFDNNEDAELALEMVSGRWL